MKKLLVTGASGFLGSNVCRVAQASWEVFGLYRTKPMSIENVKTMQADLADREPFETMFREVRPNAVIHCAAFPDPNECQKNPDASYRANVLASIVVATLCADAHIPCVFTSSDLVFGGNNPPYAEDSPLDPVNIYGQHKVAAEQGMREAFPDVTICRMPLMFGDAIAPAKSIIQPMIAAIISRKELRLFSDEYRTPVGGTSAAKGLLLALDVSSGVLHLGGRERISRYEIGVLVAKVIGKSASSIIPALQKENTMSAPRAKDVSLVSEKAFDLGFNPGTVEDQMRELECVKKIQ
jgi:dTDP-4-dehydrorhamnose reductase